MYKAISKSHVPIIFVLFNQDRTLSRQQFFKQSCVDTAFPIKMCFLTTDNVKFALGDRRFAQSSYAYIK